MNKGNPKLIETTGLKITKLLQQSGFKVFWVGGVVRDMLIGKQSDNLDIATSANPKQIEQVLKKNRFKYISTHKKFGTITVVTPSGPIEITTFRTDQTYVNRRKPKTVKFIDDYILDSNRRDFTVNSFYYNPITKQILDPQNGQLDLNRKLIKFVGNPKKRIDEDALRMLRAVRFSVQLGFKLEKNTFAAIKTRAKYIQQISGERIKAELDKILIHPNRVQGVRLLDDLGILKFIMPELEALKYVTHKSKVYHLEGSVFEHALLTLKNLNSFVPVLAYAALYHDTGKANTATPKKKDEGIVNSFPAHEFFSADHAKRLALRLKFSKQDREKIVWISAMHMKRHAFVKDMSEKKKILLVRHKFFPLLLEIWRADSLSNIKIIDGQTQSMHPIAFEKGLELLKNIQKHQQFIEKFSDGKKIMKLAKISFGKKVGEIKTELETKIILGEIKKQSQVESFIKKFAKNP